MVQIDGLTKTFGKKTVLDDITLHLENKNYALLGPNGSGKTTLFRILTGLLNKDSGSIRIGGTDSIKNIPIGYLPQQFGTFPGLTVEEQLIYFARLKYSKCDGIEWEEETEKAIKTAHLTEQRCRKCRTLSGGMTRRLGIAQALMGNPGLILLDEPTVGLDVEERLRFKSILDEIRGRQTLIFSTHVMEDVEDTCEDVIIINDTHIIYQGELAGLRKPALQDGYLSLIRESRV